MRRVSIYRRKGRKGWTVQYYDPSSGRRAWVLADTLEQAEAEQDRIQKMLRAAEGLSADVLLRDYAPTWFLRIAKTIKPGTAHVYAWAMDTHILPGLGWRRMRETSTAHVKDFLAGRLAVGLAKKTVHNIRSTLHSVFEEAIDDKIVSTNPVAFRSKLLRLTPTRAERRAKVKALTIEQLQAFSSAAPNTVSESRALLFWLMWSTGIRPGEALGVQWSDLHSSAGQLRIARAFTFSRIQSTKSGEERTIDVPRQVCDALDAWATKLKRQALADGEKLAPWIFPSSRGTPVSVGYVELDFKKVLKVAKLPLHLTPHCLRHTYATQQLLAGVPIPYVQQQLGHATIQMTVDTYGSWLPSGNAVHADAFQERISGAPAPTTDDRRKPARKVK